MKYTSFKKIRYLFASLCLASLLLSGCKKLDVFEKVAAVPDHNWTYAFKPSFDFDISDTTKNYRIYIVLRHTDAYKYNNIWLNIGTKYPGDSAFKQQRFELVLGSDAAGWEGTGIDDIWEVRKLITDGAVRLAKPGVYQFTIGQIMRENPLPDVMNIGVRVERDN